MNPTIVTYNLYKGGGNCSRSKFYFKNDENLKTASDTDYSKSGYDKGHMANAEDFAFDCTLDELTFRYYNCVPQNPKMNRGPWKKVESQIRDLSQSKEIFIVCINIFENNYLKNTKVGIPIECIKLIYDSKTKNPLMGFVFTNTSNPKVLEASPDEIIKMKNLNIDFLLKN
jgi:endonuclease G